MAFINVKRKTIKLPNGMKINFNKDSISYTVSNGKASYTYNPKKKIVGINWTLDFFNNNDTYSCPFQLYNL